MKTILASILLPFGLLFAQATNPAWDRYGLSGRTVYDLRMYGTKVYAATDTGVFVCTLPDFEGKPVWTLIGLPGKDVRSIYPHDVGPLLYALTAGLYRKYGDTDSCLIYCSLGSDSSWAPADTGIDRTETNVIEALDGFPDPRICGETFAGGSGKIYRRAIGGAWEKVFDDGFGVINVIRARITPPAVMAGGETGIFAPFITRSDDGGDSWKTTFPWVGGDNACNSLLFDPTDTLSVYAGMEGAVIRSTDGGATWVSAGLESTPYYFFGLAYAELYFYRDVFVVGATGGNEFAMYFSPLGSDLWFPITPPWPLKGARCILPLPRPLWVGRPLLIGTLGDGVVRFTDVYAAVDDPTLPATVHLRQNYPNPFNASCTISYEIPSRMRVRIDIFDVMGRVLSTLVDDEKPPGWHSVRFEAGAFPSGLYVCRLRTDAGERSVSMALIK